MSYGSRRGSLTLGAAVVAAGMASGPASLAMPAPLEPRDNKQTPSPDDKSAQEAVGAESAGAPARRGHKSAGRGRNRPAEVPYQPLYQSDRNTRGTAGQQTRLDFSKLSAFSIGPTITWAELGQRFQFGPVNDGILGGELSYVPWISRGLWWFGFLGSYSHDFQVTRNRVGAGIEGGIGPWGLDVSGLYKLEQDDEDEKALMLQARLSVTIPVGYNRADYSRRCCPTGSKLRSCACEHTIVFTELQPNLSVEVQDGGPERTLRVFAGLVGKFGFAN